MSLIFFKNNMEYTKNNHVPLSLKRNKNIRISTDKDALAPQQPNEISLERSPTKTEEYWSHYSQMSPTWTNRNEDYSLASSQLSKHRENVSKLVNSRSTNRLSAANEILFGQQNMFQFGFGRDNTSENKRSPSQIVFKDRNAVDGGFESYISQQERMLKEIRIPIRNNNINVNRLKAFRSNAISKESNEGFG